MTWRRTFSPQQSDPPSIVLMRALGDLLSDEEAEDTQDMDVLAVVSGIAYVDLPALIAVGVTAGYLSEDEDDGAIGLTPKGWAWYTRDLDKRG
jgi:hypothetical protein